MEPCSLLGKTIAAGRLGKKTGKGLYSYEGKEKRLDPRIYEILEVTPKPKTVSPDEIIDRCILPMINEASRCLEEGIVSDPSTVDLGMIMGTGFPPFRGGLLRYADTIGPQLLVEKLLKYKEKYGARYEPAPALLKASANHHGFYAA